MHNDATWSRRQFLLTIALAGASTAVLTCADSAFAGSPVPVGKTSEFHTDQYKKVTLPDGRSAYVTKSGNGYKALSSKCTHRGCEVLWVPSRKIFQCPCHGGQYDDQGKNIAGPPDRPLDKLTTSVEDDTVYVDPGP